MYTLFNQQENRYLKHPAVGLWYTTEKTEAEEMLESAKEYVRAVGMPELADKFSIVEISKDSLDI